MSVYFYYKSEFQSSFLRFLLIVSNNFSSIANEDKEKFTRGGHPPWEEGAEASQPNLAG